MRTIEQIFGASKIVPGAVLEDQKVALAVAGALLEANVKVMALRLLSRNSLKSLELITKEFLLFIENIMHSQDCKNSYYVNYSLIRISTFHKSNTLVI